VVSLGYPAADGSARIHEREAGSRRLPASSLFFADRLGEPLALAPDDPWATVLEAVRMAPSASNKQPWRLLRRGEDWHVLLQRTPRYGKGSALFVVLRLADLQRVDLGIALCHFELVARDLGLTGGWVLDEAAAGVAGTGLDYVATWRG
jgi:hypothetical protein